MSLSKKISTHPDLQLDPNQQRNQLEPSIDQKQFTLQALISKDPALFLERYGKLLDIEDLRHFEPLRDNYEVNFHIERLSARLQPTTLVTPSSFSTGAAILFRKRQKLIKNRRYHHLQRMIEEGHYFSQQNCKMRQPLLYDQYIGRFETEEEKRKPFDNDISLSERILFDYENSIIEDRRKEQAMQEQFSSQSFFSQHPAGNTKSGHAGFNSDDEEQMEEEDDPDDVSAEEKEGLKREFFAVMQQKFMDGEDTEFFDYTTIDEDEDLGLDHINRDAETSYFDSVDDEIAGPSSDTGVLDY